MPADILTHGKFTHLIRARWAFWHALNKELGVPMKVIGRRAGGFHHTTVLHAVRTYDLQVKSDESTRG